MTEQLVPSRRPKSRPSPAPRGDEPERLSWDSRARRMVTIYLPLALFVIVLLFPFYWMAITAIKPDDEMYDYKQVQPVLGALADAGNIASCCSRPNIRTG